MDVKWIKITTDVFEDEKMMLIDALPDADAIMVIWFKLLALAGKTNMHGFVMMSDKIPYTDEMLATIFRRPLSTVRLAISTFENFGMIEIIDNKLLISNFDKHQSVEGLDKIREQGRIRQQRYREKQLQTQEHELLEGPKEKDKKPKAQKETKHKHGELENVLLTDKEYEKLKKKFNDTEKRINDLGYYLASTGKTYKSHYMTIMSWARKEDTPNTKETTNHKIENQKPQELW